MIIFTGESNIYIIKKEKKKKDLVVIIFLLEVNSLNYRWIKLLSSAKNLEFLKYGCTIKNNKKLLEDIANMDVP